ncbi:MAG: hypothetical protein K2G37_01065 [Clostridia bacterium]|nr:hypothetical protein [Clostridia bacterium]
MSVAALNVVAYVGVAYRQEMLAVGVKIFEISLSFDFAKENTRRGY